MLSVSSPGQPLRLVWLGGDGLLYQLQTIEDLGQAADPAAWRNLGDLIAGHDRPIELSLPGDRGIEPQVPCLFYRLQVFSR